MRFFNDLGLGFSSHIKAISFIAKHNLWLYFLWPLLIAIGLWVAGFASTFYMGDWLGDKVVSWISLDKSFDIDWLEWLRPFLSGAISIILKVFLFFLFASLLKYIVLIIASPILALLSERVDEILTGTSVPFHFGQFLHDMLRGILITLRNMLLETLIWLGCLLFGLLPIVGWLLGWLTIPLQWFIAWYFLGFSMMDYSYERRKMTIRQGVAFTRRHKGIAIANGFLFSMLLYIPVLGISIAPVLSCVAGTLAVIEASERDRKAGYQQTLRTV